MKNANRNDDGLPIWRPEGEMTIYTAADNKANLAAALNGNKALEIDLSGVSEMDTAGLQLLILAKQEALQRGVDLHIRGHATAVVDVLDLCNMIGFFGDPVVMTSDIR